MIQNKHNYNRISVKDYCCLETVRAVTRELKIRRRRRQRERQKSNRFRLAKQQLCTCITLFCTYLCRRYMTSTWKCLISGFVEEGNRRQQLQSNLRSRCLEVVGARKNGHERETRVYPSRAPVLSCAHFFQAPATQANNFLFLFLSFDTVL